MDNPNPNMDSPSPNMVNLSHSTVNLRWEDNQGAQIAEGLL